MRRVVPSRLVPTLWAEQSQSDARNSRRNLYFDGDTIYSYGLHFPMGRVVGRVAVITSRTYSNTTAKHIGMTRLAAMRAGLTECMIPDVVNISNPENMRWLESQVNDSELKATRARKYGDFHRSNAERYRGYINILRRLTNA